MSHRKSIYIISYLLALVSQLMEKIIKPSKNCTVRLAVTTYTSYCTRGNYRFAALSNVTHPYRPL